MKWIKHNFSTILAICLIMVLGGALIFLPDFSVGTEKQAGPGEPAVDLIEDTQTGTYSITGVNSTMEYNTVSPTHTVWKTCSEDGAELTGLKSSAVYYIRVKETDTTLAGTPKTLSYGTLTGPSGIQIVDNGKNGYKLEGMTTDMEYNTDSPIYEGTWEKYDEGELTDIQETTIYYVRYAAKEAVGETPAQKASIASRFTVVCLTKNYNEDGTYDLLGLNEKMEYNTETGADGEVWTKYTSSSLKNVNESKTYYIRIAASSEEKVQSIGSIEVKVKPVAPDVEIVDNNNGSYTISGMETTMEYNTVSKEYAGAWTKYVDGALENITESGEYHIRYSATATSDAGFVKTLRVTVIERPDAPNITAEQNNDGSVKLVGMTVAMEYNTESKDYAGEWTRWSAGALQNITKSATYYIRVAKDGETPSGNILVLPITINVLQLPAAPTITVEENDDGNKKLVGMTTAMEYNTISADYAEVWTRWSTGALQDITESAVYYIRIAKNGDIPAGNVLKLSVRGPAPNVTAKQNEDYSVRFDEMNTTMEYNTETGADNETWTRWSEGELQNITEEGTYYIRVAANGDIPSSDMLVYTIKFEQIPIMPTITIEFNVDGSVKLIGMTTAMEYNTISANYAEEWTRWSTGDLQNITSNITYYIRIAANGDIPAGEVKEIVVTPKEKPAVPDIDVEYNQDGSKKLVGMTTAMEYNMVSEDYAEEWTRWSTGELQNITGSVIYYIRVAKNGDTPAGNILKLVVGAPEPKITVEVNNDYSIKLVGLNTTMEYNTESEDYAGTWTRWSAGALQSINESATYYIRVAANGELPSGDVWTHTITFNVSPSAPEITVEENDDGSKKLVGMTTAMEYNTISADYAEEWTRWSAGALQNITESTSYYIRVAANGDIPAGQIKSVIVEINVIEVIPAVKFKWNILNKDALVQLTINGTTKIDWGDGNVTEISGTGTSAVINHTYENTGVYEVKVLDDIVTELELTSLNEIKELDVRNNKKLTKLSIYSQSISELDLTNNTELINLNCSNSNISNLDLSKNTKLIELNCSNSNISNLDLSENIELINLNCSDNNISNLDLSKNTKLVELNCSYNKISELNVSGNVKLTTLYCSNNNMNKLILGNNSQLIDLYCLGNNISELNLTYCSELTYLNCSYNDINELNVSSNTKLHTLRCVDNNISEIDLSGNTELAILDCSLNKISELDVSSNLKLTDLYCYSNNLNELNINSNVALVNLNCNDNKLKDLNIRGNLLINAVNCIQEKMEYLYVTENQQNSLTIESYDISNDAIARDTIRKYSDTIVSTKPFAPKITLESNGDRSVKLVGMDTTMEYNTIGRDYEGEWTKYVAGTLQNIIEDDTYYIRVAEDGVNPAGEVTTIEILGLEAAITFNWQGSSYTSITIATKGATRIDWGDGHIEDIPIISEARSISHPYDDNSKYTVRIFDDVVTELDLSNNAVSRLEVGNNLSLEKLICSGSPAEVFLDELDVSKNINLTYLDCQYNNISELDVSKNINLTYLNCGNNNMSNLDVSENTNLAYLNCGNNGISNLDVSTNVKLNTLECELNSLSNINLTNNIALIKVYLRFNQLSNLDVRSNINLTELWCSSNNLSEIDVTNNVNLTKLICDFNSLSELDISKNIELKELQCSDNNLSQLDISKNINLAVLGCNANKLTELNIRKNNLINSIACVQEVMETLYLTVEQREKLQIINEEMTTIVPVDGANIIYKHPNTAVITDIISPPTVTLEKNDDGSFKFIGMTDKMEYNTVSPDYEGEWIKYQDGTLQNVPEGTTYYIRIAPDGAVLELTAEVKLIPGVPNVTIGFNQDGSVKLVGMDITLEYNTISIDYAGEWRKYQDGELQNITENKTYYIRVAAVGGNPAGEVLVLTVVLRERPMAPVITVKSNTNGSVKLVGMNVTLEYNTVSANYEGEWTKYTEGSLQSITQNTIYYIRVAQNGTVPFGNVSTVKVEFVTINVEDAKNGTISPDGKIRLLKGESKTFTITPNKGYKVLDVVVNGESVGAVESYTVKNITKDITISASFKAKSSSGGGSSSSGGGIVRYPVNTSLLNTSWKNPFNDVSKENWYYDAVEYVNDRKYFNGTTETKFSPETPMTREMIVTVLYNMERTPIVYGTLDYTDVEYGRWSESAIIWATRYGIISGYPNGSFKPTREISREELATMLKKYCNYKQKALYKMNSIEGFVDNTNVSEWATENITWAVSNKVMSGYNKEDGQYLLPQRSATRAEVAMMIMNYCKAKN